LHSICMGCGFEQYMAEIQIYLQKKLIIINSMYKIINTKIGLFNTRSSENALP
jgi:hypothetical protein